MHGEPRLWSATAPSDSLRLNSTVVRARGLRLRERRFTVSPELNKISSASGLDFLRSEGSSGLHDLLLLSFERSVDEVTLVKLRSDETDETDIDLVKPTLLLAPRRSDRLRAKLGRGSV